MQSNHCKIHKYLFDNQAQYYVAIEIMNTTTIANI